MASSIVLKRLVSGNIINRSLRPVGSAASSHFTATEGQIIDSDRRSDAPLSSRREFHRFPDAISPFLPRSLSQIINTTHSSTASGISCDGDAMGMLNGMYFSKGMSTMVSKGGSQKSYEEDGKKRNFSTTAALQDESYKTKSPRHNKPQLSSAAPILDKISIIILAPIVLASHLFSKVGSVALTYGNFSLFKHINNGMKEILADYVHHEMTRNMILISLRLFLLIVIKDVFLSVVF